MKILKIIFIISIIFVLLMSIIGIMTSVIFVHEYTHYRENIAKNITVEQFCVWGFYGANRDMFKYSDGAAGYVMTNGEKLGEYNADRNSNISAVFLTIMLLISFISIYERFK